MLFLIFILATIGMSLILVDGSIFKSFKEWLGKPSWCGLCTWMKEKLLALMSCYQCSGFWSGAVVGLLMWLLNCDPLYSPKSWEVLMSLFVYACIGSYVSMKAAILSIWVQTHSQIGDEE
jgi:membrane-anchored protein YejM (alkaline phosphatase superfamily)